MACSTSPRSTPQPQLDDPNDRRPHRDRRRPRPTKRPAMTSPVRVYADQFHACTRCSPATPTRLWTSCDAAWTSPPRVSLQRWRLWVDSLTAAFDDDANHPPRARRPPRPRLLDRRDRRPRHRLTLFRDLLDTHTRVFRRRPPVHPDHPRTAVDDVTGPAPTPRGGTHPRRPFDREIAAKRCNFEQRITVGILLRRDLRLCW